MGIWDISVSDVDTDALDDHENDGDNADSCWFICGEIGVFRCTSRKLWTRPEWQWVGICEGLRIWWVYLNTIVNIVTTIAASNGD